MRFLTIALATVLALSVTAQDNPAGRTVGEDGKPLVKAADASVATAPAQGGTESWTTLIAAVTAAIIAILGAINSFRNGSKILAVHKTLKGEDEPQPHPIAQPERSAVFRAEVPPPGGK